MEKEITKEAKAETSVVKQELKDLTRLEKDVRAAQKSAANADSTLSKREKYEHKTAKRMNEAIHEHDIALAKLQAAAKDVKFRHDHRTRLMNELEVKKGIVEKAIESQVEHDVSIYAKVIVIRDSLKPQRVRESKLTHYREASMSSGQSSLPPKVAGDGLPGQIGPAVMNNGHAAGYGVDFNHIAVDSEGYPRAAN